MEDCAEFEDIRPCHYKEINAVLKLSISKPEFTYYNRISFPDTPQERELFCTFATDRLKNLNSNSKLLRRMFLKLYANPVYNLHCQLYVRV